MARKLWSAKIGASSASGWPSFWKTKKAGRRLWLFRCPVAGHEIDRRWKSKTSRKVLYED